jgi:hypothetical protein
MGGKLEPSLSPMKVFDRVSAPGRRANRKCEGPRAEAAYRVAYPNNGVTPGLVGGINEEFLEWAGYRIRRIGRPAPVHERLVLGPSRHSGRKGPRANGARNDAQACAAPGLGAPLMPNVLGGRRLDALARFGPDEQAS